MRHNINNNRISELLVCASIGNRDFEIVREAHQPRAFSRRQSARVLALTLINQDFRSVLVVARREGARDVVRRDQSEAETVSLGAVLFGVALQVVPEVIGKGVFVLHPLLLVIEESFFVPFQYRLGAVGAMQDAFQFYLALGAQGQRAEVECNRLLKADDDDALPMLGREMRPIYHAIVNVVAKLVCQGAPDDIEGAPLVV